MSERFLKWAVKRHYKALGYKVSMRRIRLGNTEVDGEATGPDGQRIAIEIKPRVLAGVPLASLEFIIIPK